MVGGWDKSPGPDNDYAGRPWTRSHSIYLIVILAYIAVLTAVGVMWSG